MPPKKGKKGGKKGKGKNSGKPSWMSDEVWALSQDITKLAEIYKLGLETKGKADAKEPAASTPPIITKAQAALFLWQQLYPADAKAKREEAVKLECIEASVKLIATAELPEATAAMGVLNALIQTEAGRETLVTSKPAPIPLILNALTSTSTSYVTAACAVFKSLAVAPDTRCRVLKAVKEWSWKPLIQTLRLQNTMPMMGGRNATLDAVLALEALVIGPVPNEKDKGGGLTTAEKALGEIVAPKIMEVAGFEALVKAAATHHAFPVCKASAVNTLHMLMRRVEPSVIKALFQSCGAVPAMVKLMSDPLLPLVAKANAAGCLWLFMMPDACIKDDSLQSVLSRISAGQGKAGAGLAMVNEGVDEVKFSDAMTFAINNTLEADENVQETCKIEDFLIDEQTREQVMERVHIVAEAKSITPLIHLCAGPEGPLPDINTVSKDTTKKKKKSKKKGKKKAKLEPGMAEAQLFATACLRLLSLSDTNKDLMRAAGGVRYLTPLLDSRVHRARWNARQTLLNMAMVHENIAEMEKYKVPNYVHGANIPHQHYNRPGTQLSQTFITSAPVSLTTAKPEAAAKPHSSTPHRSSNLARPTSNGSQDAPTTPPTVVQTTPQTPPDSATAT